MHRRPSARLTKPRSLRRSATDPSITSPGPSLPLRPLPQHHPLDNLPSLDIARHAQRTDMDKPEEKETSLVNTASIIPDNLPAWYNKDVWASVPPPMYKAVYRIHNPMGPRWYRNYHLIPPSQLRRGARPPSFFSPSFPPMASTSLPERSLDSAAPSRTPSGSPLPTPSSSQTRVGDASNKPRSRKPSLTTPDGVEIDITDPWGATWHHSSPYDFGISPSAANDFHANSRPRRVSMTPYVKRKAAPSPLSQSTSVEHLEPQNGPNVLRKPSKRRTPSIGSIFGNNSSEANRNTVSAPTTPIDTAQDVASSSASIMTKSSKKEKRGSVLDRLAKKLSLLRKSTGGGKSAVKEDWHYVAPDVTYSQHTEPPTIVAEPSIGEVGRNPSPSLNEQSPHVSKEADRSSSISLEDPYSTGKLTVANPDLPSSENTPTPSVAPLPPDKFDHVPIESSPIPNQPEIVQALLQSPGPLSSKIIPNRLPDIQSSKSTDPTHSPHQQPSHISIENPDPVHPPQFHSDVGNADLIHSQQSLNIIDNAESLPPTPPAKSRAPSPGIPAPVKPTDVILQDVAVNDKSSASHDSSTIHQAATNAQTVPTDDLRPQNTSRKAVTTHSISDTPFPTDDVQVLVPPRARFSYATSSDYSPMSISSMVVNPPTPYNPELSMLDTPEPPPPVFLARDKQTVMKDTVTHKCKAGSKHTEMFKFVSGASNRVHGTTDIIVATGHLETEGNHVKQLSKNNGVEGSREKKERSTGESSKEKERRKDDRSDDKDREKMRHREGNKTMEKGSKREAEKEHVEKEREREREREWQRQKDLERATEKALHREREKEKERQREKERVKEKEREREKEKEREKERERERAKEKEREREREREQEREREKERHREKEREREKAREREREKEKEREREREKAREKERERERQREREKERERQRERERERERQKEKEERQKEKEERLREKEREKERQREKDRARQEREEKERHEKERHKEKERKKKEKESDKRERNSARREDRIHPEGPRHRTPSQVNMNHKHDTREGSASTFSVDQIPTDARSIHGRSGDHEGNRIRHPERANAGRGNNDASAVLAQTTRPPLERNSSVSTRPTSELPSAAELIALRAKEAFEMDRLFKARSLFGQEPDAYVPNSIPSSVASDTASSTGAVYGSSHTAYVVQTSFQTSRNVPHPQMRDLHPSPPASYLSENDLLSIPSLDSSTNRRLSNPLPEPPRQSAYQPLPLSLLETGGAYSSDWTKYPVTTAH